MGNKHISRLLVLFPISILLVILLGFLSLLAYGLIQVWGPIIFGLVIVVIVLLVLLYSGKITLPKNVIKICMYIATGAFVVFQVLSLIFLALMALIMYPFTLGMESAMNYLINIPVMIKVRRMTRKNDIDGLILALESDDWELRYKAAKALRGIGDERAVEPLARFETEVDAMETAFYSKSPSYPRFLWF